MHLAVWPRVGLNTGIMRCQLAWVIFHTSSDQKKEFSEGRINCLRDHVITLGVYMTLPGTPIIPLIPKKQSLANGPLFHLMEAGIAP